MDNETLPNVALDELYTVSTGYPQFPQGGKTFLQNPCEYVDNFCKHECINVELSTNAYGKPLFSKVIHIYPQVGRFFYTHPCGILDKVIHSLWISQRVIHRLAYISSFTSFACGKLISRLLK
ncbi:hypothetical protein WS08_0002 [Weissella tructae]|uniref:Uncharacterized protein n=1 Tax=Weissella tructae TaxID=887702 RepID=A0ABN4DH33_9LACO|nr:hypothetical protein WS08_0002 [Weissella tructae]